MASDDAAEERRPCPRRGEDPSAKLGEAPPPSEKDPLENALTPKKSSGPPSLRALGEVTEGRRYNPLEPTVNVTLLDAVDSPALSKGLICRDGGMEREAEEGEAMEESELNWMCLEVAPDANGS